MAKTGFNVNEFCMMKILDVRLEDLPYRRASKYCQEERAGVGEPGDQKRITSIEFVKMAYILQLKFEHKLSDSEEKL